MTRYAARTEVSADRSEVEIKALLRRYGAESFASGWMGRDHYLMFDYAGRRIRFTLPMPDPADDEFRLTPTGKERAEAAAQREYEQAIRQRWRALLLAIKAKLESVEAGIETFEQVFLAHIVVPGANTTVGEWAAPQLDAAYTSGTMPALLPGTGGTDEG